MPAKLLLVQNWGKMTHLPQPQQQGPLLEISYIPRTIVCNDTPLDYIKFQVLKLI